MAAQDHEVKGRETGDVPSTPGKGSDRKPSRPKHIKWRRFQRGRWYWDCDGGRMVANCFTVRNMHKAAYGKKCLKTDSVNHLSVLDFIGCQRIAGWAIGQVRLCGLLQSHCILNNPDMLASLHFGLMILAKKETSLRAKEVSDAKKRKAREEAQDGKAKAGPSFRALDSDDVAYKQEPGNTSQDAAARSNHPSVRYAAQLNKIDDSDDDPDAMSSPRKAARTAQFSTSRASLRESPDFAVSLLVTTHPRNPDEAASRDRAEVPIGNLLDNPIVLEDGHPLTSAILDLPRQDGIILKKSTRQMIDHETANMVEAHKAEVRQHKDLNASLKRTMDEIETKYTTVKHRVDKLEESLEHLIQIGSPRGSDEPYDA
ncbi:hypothetical protein BJ878DRAFT_577651 [Calycina marina]|uniref:Uncharacterized protein n=1 Tax=Calycina marina TaxID=1763456 RepID=A0A9P7YYN6_9HELO|nr:hypothetical protein BJ878DRAFT_577651 [Calycina marina]